MRCPFPYMSTNVTNPNGPCDQTMAEAGGTTYKVFMAGWLVGITVLLLLTAIQFIRMLKSRGYSRHLFYTSYLHQVYSISLYNAITLLIRMCDTMNWGNKINYTFFRIMLNTSTWACYALILLCVCSWMKIMFQISGRSRNPVILTERVTLVVTYLFYFIIAIIQSHVDNMYVAVVVELIFCVVYSIILMTIAWTNGLRVYCHLARYENGTVSTSSKPSQNSQPIGSPATSIPASPTTPNKSIRPKESVQKKKSRIVVLLKLLIYVTACVVAAAILQIYFAIEALKNKYDRHTNPEPYPDFTFGNLLNASGFSIVQCLASVCILIFFRKFGNDSSKDMSSADAKSNSDPHSQQTTHNKTGRSQPNSPHAHYRQNTATRLSGHIKPVAIEMNAYIPNPLSNTSVDLTSNLELLSPGHVRSSSNVSVDAVTVDIPSPLSTRPNLPTHPNSATYTHTMSPDAHTRTLITPTQERDSHSQCHPFQPQGVPAFESSVDLSNIVIEPQHARNSSSSNQLTPVGSQTPRSVSKKSNSRTPRRPASNHI